MVKTALRMFLWISILCGIIYPLLITVIAGLCMPRMASGSLIQRDNKLIGSALIGQKFESTNHFWSRPSAVNYSPLPSGASNLGPTSGELKKIVDARREKIIKDFAVSDPHSIPSELLFASGSGLDPHISPNCAYFQMESLAKNLKVDKAEIRALIDSHIERRKIGFLGEPCINVLKLNLAIEELKVSK